MKSIFPDSIKTPTDDDLKSALSATYYLWHKLANYTLTLYPEAICGWHFSGEKYGWSYRISDKKRVLLYLLPRDGYFKTAFVFGQKAVATIMDSTICDTLKTAIAAAKPYAEGRGIRIDVQDNTLVNDIQQLITIKLST